MIKEHIKNKLQLAIKKINAGKVDILIEAPSDNAFGDYTSTIAMQLAKTIKRNPMDIAEEINTHISPDHVIKSVKIVKPGFINFWITEEQLLSELLSIKNKGPQYGKSDWGTGKTWLIEHTSPNPNKAMHLGHLRNNVTGSAIASIWEYGNIHVIRDSVDNNRGISIAKLMWGFLKFARKKETTPISIEYWFDHRDEWNNPQNLNIRPDKFVEKLYVQGSDDCKNIDIEKEVRQLVINWEKCDKTNWALWEHVLNYSYEGQELTLKRLGNKWDKVWHEHEHYEYGKLLVEDGLKKKIFVKLKDGAILSNLSSYKIPDTILMKSDGTSLYITQDLALTKLKIKTFNPDRLFWTIGSEQGLALRQLFAICDQLGIGKKDMFQHVSYGFMSIKNQGKMSSRTGNVIYIDDLIDAAKKIILQRMENSELNNAEKDIIAEKISVGAVKYGILRVGRATNTAFDIDTSLAMAGDSCPYILYTYTRCKSLLNRASESMHEVNLNNNFILNTEESLLTRTLIKFTDIVEQAGKTMSPNVICSYIFSLCQSFNVFYEKSPILKEKNDVKNFRLLLVSAVSQVIKNGLFVLGIDTVEKM